jgi:hypothetical protein
VLVQVAVMSDLVAIGKRCLDGVRVALDAPGRNEESLLDAHLSVERKDARHGDPRAVLQRRHGGREIGGILVMRKVQDAVCVHVECEGHRATRSVRPGRWIGDQLAI